MSALRLAEKGYSVAVLEAGKRWDTNDFPKTNWNARKALWFPKLGMRRFLANIARHPLDFLRSLSVWRWSERGRTEPDIYPNCR